MLIIINQLSQAKSISSTLLTEAKSITANAPAPSEPGTPATPRPGAPGVPHRLQRAKMAETMTMVERE